MDVLNADEAGQRAAQLGVLIGELTRLWVQHPEWRLGQLIRNAADSANPSASVFFISDEHLLDGMRTLSEVSNA